MGLVQRAAQNSAPQPVNLGASYNEIRNILPIQEQIINIKPPKSAYTQLMGSARQILGNPQVQTVAMGALCYFADRCLQAIGWQQP